MGLASFGNSGGSSSASNSGTWLGGTTAYLCNGLGGNHPVSNPLLSSAGGGHPPGCNPLLSPTGGGNLPAGPHSNLLQGDTPLSALMNQPHATAHSNGVVVGPCSPPVPVKIAEKIWRGDYIDLNILLPHIRSTGTHIGGVTPEATQG